MILDGIESQRSYTLIVTKLLEQENGATEVTLNLSDQQSAFIMDIGLGVLLAAGAARFVDNTPEPTIEILDQDGTIIH